MAYNDLIIRAILVNGAPHIYDIEVIQNDSSPMVEVNGTKFVGAIDFGGIQDIVEQMTSYVEQWPEGQTASFYASWEPSDTDVGIMTSGYCISEPEWVTPEPIVW